jgi:hypothetical protein
MITKVQGVHLGKVKDTQLSYVTTNGLGTNMVMIVYNKV